MTHSNISIFVPHVGCPHMCAFCDQRTITGSGRIPHGEDVRRICSEAVSRVKDPSETEIAFFGGSFTAIKRDHMLELLEAAKEFVGQGKFKGIRISTRPDHIDGEILGILKRYGVTAIELGAQSMCDRVLDANGRGHSAKDVERAAELIKSYKCFELGLQMMVGLYGSSPQNEVTSWKRITALSPDTVRIYPVVILEGTRLGELYKSGEYVPMELNKAVSLCADFLQDAERQGIKVIKLGLHASELVESQTLGGFYHPAFRELCEGEIYRRRLSQLLENKGLSSAEISVPARELSKAQGHKKSNIEYFAKMGISLKIIPDKSQQEKLKIINTL